MNPHLHPLRAALWMLAAVATFSLMDAAMKLLSAHYPPMQVATLRGAASLPFVLGWVLASAGLRSIVPVRWSLHLLRAALGVAMIACFSFALKRLPMSTAYTIFFVSPMLVAALSVLLLGERVGPRRWIAIAVGLAGVAVVLRPGANGTFSLAAAMVLVSALAYALASVLVRLQTRTDTSQAMVVWFLALLALGAGVLAAPGWVALRVQDMWLVAGMGLAGALGQVALTRAFQLGEASMVAPLEYTGLLWVATWDWLFWKTLPAASVWVGAAVIIASGVYLLRRERAHSEAEHP
ncbi:MAG: DMT family transporter [Pseudoxanthomonas sp.]